MFHSRTRILKCDLCEHGFMNYDEQATADSYIESCVFQIKNLNEFIDKAINSYLIFSCHSCGNQKRYTYREIEKLMREDITKRVIYNIQTNQFFKILPKINERSYMIYCGKCTGFDGKGSCFPQIYKNCKIKRFPYVI